MRRLAARTFLSATVIAGLFSTNRTIAAPPDSVAKSLTISATIDNGPDADFAKGDRKIYTAPTGKREEAKPGLGADSEIAKGKGRRGDALRFKKKS